MQLHEGSEHAFNDKIKALEALCRETGLRLTHQRLEIFRELTRSSDHPSAETVHRRVRVRIPTISLDTVYRTISTFERYGLITRIQVFDDHGRFEPDLSPHHHLVCSQCKGIMDFGWETFDNAVLPDETKEWGRVSTKHAVLRGICRRCLEADKKSIA